MKKILLASTALVVTAGIAAADVKVKGDAYYGVGYGTYDGKGVFNSTSSTNPRDYGFIYDLDIDFTLSGETDSGLTFGAATDLDDNAGASQGYRGFEGSVFVSGAFGTLTMGDINGGAETVTGDMDGVGLGGLGDYNEFTYLIDANATNGPVARYDYTYDSFKLSFGMTDDSNYSIGAGYNGGIWSVGIGYEAIQDGTLVSLTGDDSGFDIANIIVDSAGNPLGTSFTTTNDASQVIGTASVNLSGVVLTAGYGRFDFDEATVEGADQYGISAAYNVGAFGVSGFYKIQDIDVKGGSDRTNNFYGVGASYDLGGGLALIGGVSVADLEDATSELTTADFGLKFKF